MTAALRVVKAHAYGNDFLLVEEIAIQALSADQDPSLVARALCARHTGIGADGLVLYDLGDRAATMRLFNADGSASELSGNGLRCLASVVAREQHLRAGAAVTVETDAGVKRLDLLACEEERYVFRAALGQPEDIRQLSIPLPSETVVATVLRVGNPQCVIVGPLPDAETFARLGPLLSTHPMFPAGTNVEFAHVETPNRVRILIWERGVGPTTSSGTGTCASAVAAAAHGGAAREVDVVAPGGTQRVEWRSEGVYLTGWAEIVLDGDWLVNTAAQ